MQGKCLAPCLLEQVRLVFSAAASAAAAKDPKPAGPEVDLQGSSSDVEEDLQAPHAAELEPAVVVGQLLSSVAEEQQALIEAICRQASCLSIGHT